MYPLNKNNKFLKNNINCNLRGTECQPNKTPITELNTQTIKPINLETEYYWEILKQSYPYDKTKKYCVFFNGCCCPPHKGHINSIRQAIKMFPGCKVIMNQLGSSKRHGVPSKFNSYLLQKYLSEVFDNSPNIKYMFRESTKTIFSHKFITESNVVIIIRGEEFESGDNIQKVIKNKNKKNFDRFSKYINKLNSMNIKVDFVSQTRPIDKVSATKFMEKLDEYRYKKEKNEESKIDLYELMEFIPDEISSSKKYQIIKKLLSYDTYV